MNKRIIVLMMLVAVFSLLLASVCAIGQSYTENEKYCREIGNKSHILTVAATYAATALMTYYQLFRTSSAITVDKIGLRTGAGTGSFVGYPLRFGIMNVNSSGFLTTWCGATGDARETWYPTFSAWNEVTLNETASLADNTMYALVWEDYNGTGVLSAARRFYYYTTATPAAGFETVRGLNASVESLDCFVTKTTAGVYSFQYSLLGWYIRDSMVAGYGDTAYQGVSYGALTARVCYNQYSFYQSFYQYNTATVDCFSLKVINNGLGAWHKNGLHVELYNPSNSMVWSGSLDMNSYHAGAGYSWYDYYINPPLVLTPGAYWFKVWSTCPSTTTGYTLLSLALLDTAGSLHQSLTYQGDAYYLKTTTDNGSGWTAVKISDLIFKFHLAPTITTYENPINSSGTHQTAYNSLTYNFMAWANYTGYNFLNFLEYLVNSTGTHQTYWTGTTWNIYNNYTGATTPLIQIQNLINVLGTHEYILTGAGYLDYANYTGVGVGNKIRVYGMDYSPGEPGTIYTQILNDDGTPANGSSPTVTIWEKTNKFIDTAPMTYISGSNGCYYYDFTVPTNISVFLADVKSSNPVAYGSGVFHVSEWSSAIPHINNTVNAINTTVNDVSLKLAYINGTYLPSIQGTIDDLNVLCNKINGNVSNLTVSLNEIYPLVWEVYNVSQYLNGTIWDGHIVSEMLDLLNYINSSGGSGFNASALYNITDDIENIVLDINTTINSLANNTEVRLTDFGELMVGKAYLAQVTVFDSDGRMMNPDVPPTISLYDASGNPIVSDAVMTWVSTGQYAYSYTTVAGQQSGQWTTLTKTIVQGSTMRNIEYWELEANPPEVTLTVIDPYIPSIDGEIKITNEGSSAQEYFYLWWITPRADGYYADADTVDSGSASKLIGPLVTFTTTETLTVPTTGTYWYKVLVYYGTEWSAASAMFNAVSSTGNENNAGFSGRDGKFSSSGDGNGGSGTTGDGINWIFIIAMFAVIVVAIVAIALKKRHR